MRISISLLLAFILFAFTNCSNKNEAKIIKTINAFYKNPNDFRNMDRKLVTKELGSLMNKAAGREIVEVEKVKNSNSPTDKPLCIEGDVFSSLYEGQDSLSIIDIKIEKTVATATVEFTNTQFKTTWKDEVVLQNENGWKIDNVMFKGPDVNSKSTKDILTAFINSK